MIKAIFIKMRYARRTHIKPYDSTYEPVIIKDKMAIMLLLEFNPVIR